MTPVGTERSVRSPCRRTDLRWLSPDTRTTPCGERTRASLAFSQSQSWGGIGWTVLSIGEPSATAVARSHQFPPQLFLGLGFGQRARGACGGSGIAVGWSSGTVAASVSQSSQLWQEVVLLEAALPTSSRRCRYSDTTARPTIAPTSSSCQVMPLPTLVLCLFGKRVARQDRLRPTCSPT